MQAKGSLPQRGKLPRASLLLEGAADWHLCRLGCGEEPSSAAGPGMQGTGPAGSWGVQLSVAGMLLV